MEVTSVEMNVDKKNGSKKKVDHGQERENKKAKACADYEDKLAKVMSLKDMTDSKAWRWIYDELLNARKLHEQQILTEDKTREMIRHQEAIKMINGMFLKAQQPINELNDYCVSMPLFSSEFHTRAQWNSGNGTVELVESR